MKRHIYINVVLVFALVMGGLLTTGALAQGGGHSAYLHGQHLSSGQVSEPNGTYVWSDGSPAPAYVKGSDFPLASNHTCEPTGTYVWNQSSLDPAAQCIHGGSQDHCAYHPATCSDHPENGSCG